MRLDIWSIRMRASKINGEPSFSSGPTVSETHISGAEGIYRKKVLQAVVNGYIDRAIKHPRGVPDKITISVERLLTEPETLRTLPVITAICSSPKKADTIVRQFLAASGVSSKALSAIDSVLKYKEPMRGACIMNAATGRRMEPDRRRGIRVSRFGITTAAEKKLMQNLSEHKINTAAAKEAVVLASKVSSCRGVIAEICISDDPDYTTGYIASKHLGYVRIPHIKNKHDMRGGRIFFLEKSASLNNVIDYLERVPVLIKSVSPCFGEKSIDEILDSCHK